MHTDRQSGHVAPAIESIGRRAFLLRTTSMTLAGLAAPTFAADDSSKQARSTAVVQTVLGPVAPEELGVTLMHEHAPVIDWSELYEVPPAPIAPIRETALALTSRLLDAFHKTVAPDDGPGAIVECTPIRVGRYPHLLVALAKRTSVHIIACTGFWCEALAPQHPWALRLGLEKDGVNKIAKLYVREITEGMEDPSGAWGEKFTDIKVGIIKCATSTYLRPSERRCHIAAAIASKETGCPITTHTSDGGGLEQAQLFLKHGANPEKVIIGHQGNLDDREHDIAHEYHRRIVSLGCYVQFDRVGHFEKYGNEKIARQIKSLIDAGFKKQVLLSHDHAPYFYEGYTQQQKPAQAWKTLESDYTVVTTGLVEAMLKQGVSKTDINTMLVENPKRVLAF